MFAAFVAATAIGPLFLLLAAVHRFGTPDAELWGFAAAIWVLSLICMAGALLLRPIAIRYRNLADALRPSPQVVEPRTPEVHE